MNKSLKILFFGIFLLAVALVNQVTVVPILDWLFGASHRCSATELLDLQCNSWRIKNHVIFSYFLIFIGLVGSIFSLFGALRK
jgi:hypothetical protein